MLIAASLAAAQSKPAASSTDHQLAQLRKDVDGLRKENDSLKSQVRELRSKLFRLQAKAEAFTKVELDPASPRKYQRIDASNGFFLISLDDVSPYLDGYRVSLNIGNPLGATYVGFKMNVRWGPRFDWSNFDAVAYDKWEKSVQNKEVSFTDSLKPMSWNKVEIILPATKSDQIGFIEVSLDTDTLGLARP